LVVVVLLTTPFLLTPLLVDCDDAVDEGSSEEGDVNEVSLVESVVDSLFTVEEENGGFKAWLCCEDAV
jgi:hypothetical protein